MNKTTHFQTLQQELIKAAEKHNEFRFYREYYTTETPHQCEIAQHPYNKYKNKRNFWGYPYDHNLITSIPRYINASPMHFNDHRYIAAQGPRSNTFNDFWHMVWAENAYLIVSVTNETEHKRNRIQLKFHRFWPESSTHKYGEFQVHHIDTQWAMQWQNERVEKLRRRHFQVTYKGKVREIVHLHMENWWDNGTVHPDSLLTLAQHVDDWKQQGPIVVHCAAGVGRTGTFIAFHSLYHDLLHQLTQESISSWDIAGRVKAMRSLRWGAMIGDRSQYKLLIEALQLALDKTSQIHL